MRYALNAACAVASNSTMSPDSETLRFLASNSADIICRCAIDTTMLYVSPSSVRVLGWTPEEMVGKRVADFVEEEDVPSFMVAVEHAASPGVEEAVSIVRMKRKEGLPCWLELHAGIVHDPETGEAIGAAVIMRDVTDRKRLEERLSALAPTDGLTGLANRRFFDQELEKEWKRTLRAGLQMSLIFLDVDHFKQFNDHYGHQFGDDCLRAVANAVREAVRREIDVVARYGGEEIAVILPNTDAAGSHLIAEDIRKAIMDLDIPHEKNEEGGGMVTASIGVSTALARYGGTMKMPESLLLSADNALYQAEREGRNRIATTLLMARQDI